MTNRIYKINKLIKEEISQILFSELNIKEGIFTVTAVETTNDFRQANVWLSYFGGEVKNIEILLVEKQKEIQNNLNRRLKLKHVPKIVFRFDHSGEYVEKLSQVFKEIKNKK